MFSHNIRLSGKCVAFLGIMGLAVVLVSACSRASSSAMSMKMSITPEPIVGREVTLHIELESHGTAAPNTVLTITLPSGVELVNGE